MSTQTPTPLTVVLVHGAFADASSWNGVIERLQAAGVQVTAPANPLRGISHRLRLHRQLPQADPRARPRGRPLVRRRGHHERGDRCQERRRPRLRRRLRPGRGRASGRRARAPRRTASWRAALVPLQYPTGEGAETAVEFAIDPAKFHDAFAADLPRRADRLDGGDPAPGRGAGVFGAVGPARLEVLAVLGGGRDRRQGGRHRRHPLAWPSAPEPRSPRSTART